MTIDTMVHSVTLSWDDGDITWLSAPSGTPMTTAYSTNIYNGDADWELCYITALPDAPGFETTRNDYTDTFSDTACGVVQSGEFRRTMYEAFDNVPNSTFLTIHRNVVLNTYSLSIYTSIQLGAVTMKPTGDLYGWELFFNGAPITNLSQWSIVATRYAPYYRGWKNFTIATCADIYDTFAIPAESPALYSELLPTTLTTTPVTSSTCSGSPTGVRFTDVGYFRPGTGSTPRTGRIYKSFTNIAATDIEITFSECPP
jgi:hypothetical protein